METIRNRLIHHGASIEVINGVARVRLNKTFPYQREVLDILNELRRQVQIEEAKKGYPPKRQDVEGNSDIV